jgi:DNA-binding response OmpR family regulator
VTVSQLVVLVIDGDRDHVKALSDHLQREGFVGVFVERDEAGFRKLREGLCPDIILVNLESLNMTLRTFRESLQRLDAERVPVIAMAGDAAQTEMAWKFFRSSLIRPVSYESLSHTIRVVSRNLAEPEFRTAETSTPLDSVGDRAGAGKRPKDR